MITAGLGASETAALVAAVAGAHDVGLLAALHGEPGTPAELAHRCGCDPSATARVLDVLLAAGIVDPDGTGRYGLTAPVRAAVDSAPGGLAGFAGIWQDPSGFLRSGRGPVDMDGDLAERSRSYAAAVDDLGRMFAPTAAALATRLGPLLSGDVLDLGAGSAVWGLAMIARAPAARLTAVDLPAVLPAAHRAARRLGLHDRITTIAGSYHEVALPPVAFDRVVLANVLHLESEPAAAALLRRAAATLRPGGTLVVVDALDPIGPDGALAHAAYALHLAMRTRHGRPHPASSIVEWGAAAGLTCSARVALDNPVVTLGALVMARPAATAPAPPSPTRRPGSSCAPGSGRSRGRPWR